MKKLFLLFLVLVFLTVPLFTACDDKNSPSDSESVPVDPDAKVDYPIVTDGSVTLKYWMPIASSAVEKIPSYAENTAYQLMQEKTGVKIEFIHPAVGEAKTAFNLMLLSGSLPDLIQTQDTKYYVGGLSKAQEDGAFLDLTALLPKWAPDYYKYANSTETARRQTYTDGKAIAFFKLQFTDPMPFGRIVVRKDWMKEFGIDSIKTITQLESYFQNVLDKKPGVVPFSTQFTTDVQKSQFMGLYDVLGSWYVVDGKIRNFYDQEGYKKFLTLLNSWHTKGYLSKDFASLGATLLNPLFDSGQLGAIVDSVDTVRSRTLSIKDFEIDSLPYPKLTEDQQLHSEVPNYPVDLANAWCTSISSSCKNVEAAVKFLNYAFTEEGSRIFNYGTEGKTYTVDDKGQPIFTDFMTKNPDGLSTSQVSYIHKIHFGTKLSAPDTLAHPGIAGNAESLAFRMQWCNDPTIDNLYRLPPIELSAEETIERGELLVDLEAYVRELMLKFIVGTEPLSNFDTTYKAELKKLQYDRTLEITQAAYDRYIAG